MIAVGVREDVNEFYRLRVVLTVNAVLTTNIQLWACIVQCPICCAHNLDEVKNNISRGIYYFCTIINYYERVNILSLI